MTLCVNGVSDMEINIKNSVIEFLVKFRDTYAVPAIVFLLTAVSAFSFLIFYENGLGLAYNDARSHLDIGRRVVEGLKPGLAQLGSVWLPLPHLLMIPTVWNDFMWHSGLAGALQSMVSFVATGFIIIYFLKQLGVGWLGRIIGVLIFALNLNILYLQSTAMTELLLIALMMAGAYELLLWFKNDKILNLIKSAFWIMLSSLVRYDGWFLFVFSAAIIAIQVFRKKGFKATEGTVIFFATLSGFGIVLWFLWNQLIFKDALYFMFGPYAAATQQKQLSEAGVLATKGNILFSIKVYLYALSYNSNTFLLILGTIGAIILWLDKTIRTSIKIATSALFAPVIFNILALYLGHSVLFIQGLSGNTWFNARYGIMMMPSIAIFIGYLIQKADKLRGLLIGLMMFVLFFSFANLDAVTIDDARVGSSQKNVTEVSGWLADNAKEKPGFILISVASHDAIIFSSGLPMKRFIHEGTGAYWEDATAYPDRWARWIVVRTNDLNDQVFKAIYKNPGFKHYNLVGKYPFADIYELKKEFIPNLHTEATLSKQK